VAIVLKNCRKAAAPQRLIAHPAILLKLKKNYPHFRQRARHHRQADVSVAAEDLDNARLAL